MPRFQEVCMKNTTRTNLIALSIVTVLLLIFAGAGVFTKKPILGSAGQANIGAASVDLSAKAGTSTPQIERAEPTAPRAESSSGTLDWRFWALLSVCGLAVGATL